MGRKLNQLFTKTNTDYFADRNYFNTIAKNVVYTGCIDEFFDYEYGELEYRSLKFQTKLLDVDNYQGNAVINWTEKEVPYTRIIEHKHFEKNFFSKNFNNKRISAEI